jgi:membrane fusion protein (multidrug efflux system)
MVEVEERAIASEAKEHSGDLEAERRAAGRDDRAEPLREREGRSPRTEDVAGEEHRNKTGRRSFIRRRPFLLALVLLLAAGAAAAGYVWWTEYSAYETTDDAYIDARFFTVSPQVAGYIEDVPVTDNQEVKAGAVLAVIDDRLYKAALASAEAQLRQAEAAVPNIDAQIEEQGAQIVQAQAQIEDANAALNFAEQQNTRAQKLARTGAGTVQTAQQTESQLLQARAAGVGRRAEAARRFQGAARQRGGRNCTGARTAQSSAAEYRLNRFEGRSGRTRHRPDRR